MKNKYIFGKLFARPSMAEGVGRILDMGATLQQYNTAENEDEADTNSIKDDWSTVGEDFKVSINKYEQKELTTQQ